METTIIEIDQVSYDYPDRRVLNQVSFQVEQGQFLAIVGENGSGKSTLIKCILGYCNRKERFVYLDNPNHNSMNGGGLAMFRKKRQRSTPVFR